MMSDAFTNIAKAEAILTNDLPKVEDAKSVTGESADRPCKFVVYRDGKKWYFDFRMLMRARLAFTGFEYCSDDMYWISGRLVSGAELYDSLKDEGQYKRNVVLCAICVKKGSAKMMRRPSAFRRRMFMDDVITDDAF